MRQAESSRDTVQRRKNCLRDAFVFLLWHTSRHQPIAVIGGRCRSRADNLQQGTYGSWPCNTLCTRTASLKSMSCRTGNQCSSRRTSVICSRQQQHSMIVQHNCVSLQPDAPVRISRSLKITTGRTDIFRYFPVVILASILVS